MNKVHFSLLLLVAAILATFTIPTAYCQEVISSDDKAAESLISMIPYELPTGHGKYKPARHPIPNNEEGGQANDHHGRLPPDHKPESTFEVETVPWTKSTHRGRKTLAAGNSLAFAEKGPFSTSYVIHSKGKGVDIMLMSDKDYKLWIKNEGKTDPIYIKKFSKLLVHDAEANSGTILSEDTYWFVIHNNPKFGTGNALVDYEVSFLPTSSGLTAWKVIIICCVAGVLLLAFLALILYYSSFSERGYYRAGRYDEKYFERADQRRDEERSYDTIRDRDRDRERAKETDSGFQVRTTWHTQPVSKDERQPLNQ